MFFFFFFFFFIIIIGPFMNFHLYLYQKSADFVISWVYGVKLSNLETHYHCSPEFFFFFLKMAILKNKYMYICVFVELSSVHLGFKSEILIEMF